MEKEKIGFDDLGDITEEEAEELKKYYKDLSSETERKDS